MCRRNWTFHHCDDAERTRPSQFLHRSTWKTTSASAGNSKQLRVCILKHVQLSSSLLPACGSSWDMRGMPTGDAHGRVDTCHMRVSFVSACGPHLSCGLLQASLRLRPRTHGTSRVHHFTLACWLKPSARGHKSGAMNKVGHVAIIKW